MQVVLDKAAMAKRLTVSERMLMELVRQGRVKAPERLGHRTLRFIVEDGSPLILPPIRTN